MVSFVAKWQNKSYAESEPQTGIIFLAPFVLNFMTLCLCYGHAENSWNGMLVTLQLLQIVPEVSFSTLQKFIQLFRVNATPFSATIDDRSVVF